MLVTLIDYGSGNLRSAAKAFERVAREAEIAADIVVTADADVVRRADRVVLPGVGAFADCRRGLQAVPGMIEAMDEVAHTNGRPLLGICVGMQLLADRGLEHGVHQGLGWIGGEVVALDPADSRLKVPHMGWNQLVLNTPDHPLLAGVSDGDHAYFVHSYVFAPSNPASVLVTTDYGGPVTAMVGNGCVVGTQFHPEKSQVTGLRFIANFLRWKP